ncbi:MAG: tetratricopeptide repeat protein [Verrucomicrobiota bacterium]
MSGLRSFLVWISSRTWFSGLLLGLVLLTVAATYAQVLSFHFLPFWDDDTNIHRNPLYAPLSWGSVATFWKAPFQQLYIPVTYSVWAGLVALSRVVAGTSISFGPINAALFHGTNLISHLLSTSMVFLIVRRMLGARLSTFHTTSITSPRVLLASAAGALAFGLHPIQVEAVAWVSGLRDLLGGAFSLAALALFLSWLDHSGRNTRQAFRYITATLLLILAFGSKPGSVVTPALAFLCGLWLLRIRGRSLKPLLWLIPWFIVAVLEVMMTSKAQPAAELARSLVPLWARPLVAGDAISFYIWKLIWPADPWGLCADYGRSPNSLLSAGILYWSWLIPILLACLLTFFQKLRSYLLPATLMVIGALPTLGLIPFNFQIVSTVSDRYLYLGMLGPALAFAMLISDARPRIAILLAVVFLPFWTVLTLLQLPQWEAGEFFFPATLARNPSSWKSRHNYACTLDAQGKLPEALKEFLEAIHLRPSNAEAYNDMALTLLKMGRRQEAIQEFQQSLQVRATTGAARNLAAALLMNGEPAKAAQVYRLAMQIDPGDLQDQRSLAWLLATHPDGTVRNGQEAAALSKQIVEATNGQVPLFLLTYAAALAECGAFDEASRVATMAASAYEHSGDPSMAQMIQTRVLPALSAHQPIRDNPLLR